MLIRPRAISLQSSEPIAAYIPRFPLLQPTYTVALQRASFPPQHKDKPLTPHTSRPPYQPLLPAPPPVHAPRDPGPDDAPPEPNWSLQRHIVTTLLCFLLIISLLILYTSVKKKPADLHYMSQYAGPSKFIPTPQN